MGSSAGVALFVLEHREEEEDEGGRKKGRKEEAGGRRTNCPSSCRQHPTPTMITAGAALC